jgi:hypothetical protein
MVINGGNDEAKCSRRNPFAEENFVAYAIFNSDPILEGDRKT